MLLPITTRPKHTRNATWRRNLLALVWNFYEIRRLIKLEDSTFQLKTVACALEWALGQEPYAVTGWEGSPCPL
jgi:hypothetical protein